MDDPRDKLRNSNDNLGNKPREKGITFLVVDYFPFFSFFFYLRFQREEGGGGDVVHPRCKLVPREIVTAFRAMNILRRWKRDRPTDFSHDATRRIFEHFFPGAFSAREGKRRSFA